MENNEKLLNCLATHWPDAERYGDIRDVGKNNLKPVDLICGGFPCQDVSSAGKGAGLSGSRSGLWYEMARVIGELRPQWVVVENVASGAKKWTDEIRCDLGELGYATLPVPIAAKDCGAWHERKRVFVIAYADRDSKPYESINAEMAETSEPSFANNGRAGLSGTQPRRFAPKLTMPSSHSGWAVEPDVVRMVHGVPGRVDRISALGNSVVPQQAQVVGEVINLLIGAKP